MDEELEHLLASIRKAGASPSDVDPADDSIPMLTEIVEPGSTRLATGPLQGSDPPRSPSPSELESRIVEQILDRLRCEPDRVETAVNDAVSAAADRFAVMISIELGRDLEQTIRAALEPAVRRAVREALAGLPEQPTL